jgi:hypothetical protein
MNSNDSLLDYKTDLLFEFEMSNTYDKAILNGTPIKSRQATPHQHSNHQSKSIVIQLQPDIKSLEQTDPILNAYLKGQQEEHHHQESTHRLSPNQ